MFKNSYKYLILFFSIFFIFGDKVYVEAENTAVPNEGDIPNLTCRYDTEKKSWMISQNSLGEISLYFNSEGESVGDNDNNWEEYVAEINLGDRNFDWLVTWGSHLSSSKPNYLGNCPGAIVFYNNKFYIFSTKDAALNLYHEDYVNELSSKSGAYTKPEVTLDIISPGTYIDKECPSAASTPWLKENNAYGSCLYQAKAKHNNGCHVIQIDFYKGGKIETISDYPVKKVERSGHNFDLAKDNFNFGTIRDKYSCKCPPVIYVYSEVKEGGYDRGVDHYFYLTLEKAEAVPYKNINHNGKNLCDGTSMEVDLDGFDLNFIDTRDTIVSCEDIIGKSGKLVNLLKLLVNLVKFIVPIMIVVLGSLDFVKAIFANDDGNMKKAQAKFIKRVLIGVVVFLAPSILKFVLQIANSIWPIIDADLCGIL